SGGDFAVAQVDEAGAPATGFGAEGGVAVVAPGGDDDDARAVAVLPDGLIVVAGTRSQGGVRSRAFAVATLGAGGAPGPAFGAGGIVSFDVGAGGTWEEIVAERHGLAVDSRGRIVVAGYVHEKPQMGPGYRRTVLARLRDDGTLDPLFG